ncbi:hypothetical protein FRC03_008959 [Tulasnella sp. 419]|nr:hypothetical protein FRC03_008959 [Tulasnella sp. 419]
MCWYQVHMHALSPDAIYTAFLYKNRSPRFRFFTFLFEILPTHILVITVLVAHASALSFFKKNLLVNSGCPSNTTLALDPDKPTTVGEVGFAYKDTNGCVYVHSDRASTEYRGQSLEQFVYTLVKTPLPPTKTWSVEKIRLFERAGLLSNAGPSSQEDEKVEKKLLPLNQIKDKSGRGWLKLGYGPEYVPSDKLEKYRVIIDDSGRRHPDSSRDECDKVVRAMDDAKERAIYDSIHQYGIRKKGNRRYEDQDFVFADTSEDEEILFAANLSISKVWRWFVIKPKQRNC